MLNTTRTFSNLITYKCITKKLAKRIIKKQPLQHDHNFVKFWNKYKTINIIQECNEPLLFCSNLLVIPKKDKKLLRIILDGRLLNNATIHQPTNLFNSAEIKMFFLQSKIRLPPLTFQMRFFQIQLSSKSQPLTAFILKKEKLEKDTALWELHKD